MRLSAIDCLRRGLLSARANWELTATQVVATLTVTALGFLGLLPLLLVLGISVSSFGEFYAASAAGGVEAAEQLESWMSNLRFEPVPFLLALLAACVVWMIAFFAACFFQGGLFGVLTAGDRQAPPDARDWQWLRTFSWRDFSGWGARYLWRFFWFINLAMAVFTVWCLGLLLLILFAAFATETWGAAAAIGIGCSGALPLGFLFAVTAVWSMVAQADLGRPESGPLKAARHGVRLVGNRLGAVTLLAFLFFASIVASSFVLLPARMLSSFVVGQSGVGAWMAAAVFQVVTWTITAAITLVFSAALVALARSEAATSASGASSAAEAATPG